MDLSIDLYLKVIQIIKAVENFLKTDNCGVVLDRKTITNIKYYVAMMTGIRLAGGKDDITSKLAALPSITISEVTLRESLNKVLLEFNQLGGTDQVAKGSEMVGNLLS